MDEQKQSQNETTNEEEKQVSDSQVVENEVNEKEVVESKVNENEVTENKDETKEMKSDKKRKVIRIIKQVCLIAITSILIFFTCIFGWLAIDKYALKSRAPSVFGYSSFVVATGSMTGTIDIGDMVIVKKTNNYKIGDIITFFQDGQTIPTTHRIVGISGDCYITKGDFNNAIDGDLVEKEMIVGEVVSTLKGMGVFVDWIKNGGGIFYIVSFVAILGLGIYVIKKE